MAVETSQVAMLTSMATRHVLNALAEKFSADRRWDLTVESAGGVEINRRIRGGVTADLAVLSADALASLAVDGFVDEDSIRPLFNSQVVGATPDRAPTVDFQTLRGLRDVLGQASRIAYSTGPSGTALIALIDRMGLTAELAERLVQAPPGVPVGELLAKGKADVGFQQRSELMGVPGIRIIGPLPGEAGIRSTFSIGVLTSSTQRHVARDVIGELQAADNSELASHYGLELVSPAQSD